VAYDDSISSNLSKFTKGSISFLSIAIGRDIIENKDNTNLPIVQKQMADLLRPAIPAHDNVYANTFLK